MGRQRDPWEPGFFSRAFSLFKLLIPVVVLGGLAWLQYNKWDFDQAWSRAKDYFDHAKNSSAALFPPPR
jgi:hypothetical protein